MKEMYDGTHRVGRDIVWGRQVAQSIVFSFRKNHPNSVLMMKHTGVQLFVPSRRNISGFQSPRWRLTLSDWKKKKNEKRYL